VCVCVCVCVCARVCVCVCVYKNQGYRLDDWCMKTWSLARPANHSDQLWGPQVHTDSYSMYTGTQSPGVKQLGHNGGHSPPSNTKLRTNGAIPPHHHMPLQHAPHNFYFSNGTITYTINLVMASIILHHSLTTHYNKQSIKQRTDKDTAHLWRFLNKNRL